MRYRYRGGTWEPPEWLPAEDLLRSLGDRLLTEGVESALNRAIHQGLESSDLGELDGLDSLRQQLQEKVSKAWADIDWDIVREHLTSRPKAAAGTGRPAGQERPNSLALHPQQLRLDARAGRRGALRALVEELDEQPSTFTGLSGHLRGELEKLRNAAKLLDLDAHLSGMTGLDDLDSIDLETVRAHLDGAAVDSFGALLGALKRVQSAGFVRSSGSGLQLSPRALQVLARHFLERQLERRPGATSGRHTDRHHTGAGERTGATRPLGEADSLDVAVAETVLEAVRSQAGVPVEIGRDDFQIFDREALRGRHTVLAIDVSRSMGMRDYLPSAKRLGLALTALVEQRFPRDRIDFLAFSRTARRLRLYEVGSLDWDRHHIGTNMQDALTLAQRELRGSSRLEKQVILITDGEPTAYRSAHGEILYEEPPTEAALTATLSAAARLRRNDIDLTLALVGDSPSAKVFAGQLVRAAHGHLVEVDPASLEAEIIAAFTRVG